PQADVADARAGTALGGLGDAPAAGGDLGEAEPLARAHVPTPATPSSAPLRPEAGPPTGSSPARARSPHASGRCGIERALSSPPTIRKWSWWPASQARNTIPVLYAGVGAENRWRASGSVGAKMAS